MMLVLHSMHLCKIGGFPISAGPSPAHPGGLSRKDCAIVDNFTDALCFAFRSDNTGPPIDVQVYSMPLFN